MGYLLGLNNVRRKKVNCDFIRSLSDVDKKLSKNLFLTTAGDHGAINVWIDDDGKYRCERLVFSSVRDSETFTNKKKVKLWVKAQLQFINGN